MLATTTRIRSIYVICYSVLVSIVNSQLRHWKRITVKCVSEKLILFLIVLYNRLICKSLKEKKKFPRLRNICFHSTDYVPCFIDVGYKHCDNISIFINATSTECLKNKKNMSRCMSQVLHSSGQLQLCIRFLHTSADYYEPGPYIWVKIKREELNRLKNELIISPIRGF